MDHKVALVQGVYFVITGIWPILSMKTFLLITGPKTDLWLVKTVGLILAVIGAVVLYAQMTGTVDPPVILLAIGSALGLALVEIIYVTKRVISPIYLADAFAELIFDPLVGNRSLDRLILIELSARRVVPWVPRLCSLPVLTRNSAH